MNKFVEEKKKEISSIINRLNGLLPSYKGVHSDILIHAPSILELVSSLLDEPDLSGEEDEIVKSAINYSTTIEDIIPFSEHGAYGFIDDLYLLSYAIKILSENDKKEIIEWYWEKDVNIFSLISKIIRDIENSPDENIRKAVPQILSYVNLEKQKYSSEEINVDYEPSVEKPSSGDIDTIVQEARDICDDLRASSNNRDQIFDIRVDTTVDPSLFQEQIPTHLIFHICRKAKFNNLLAPRQRSALFEIARKKMKGWKLSDKQVKYLEDLIQKTVNANVGELPCEDEPCKKCEELLEILRSLKWPLSETVKETQRLFLEKKSIEEISKIRSLSEGTIYEHLEILIKNKILNVNNVVRNDKIEEINNLIKNSNFDKLKDMKEQLNDDISYGEIKLVLASNKIKS